MSIYLMDLPRDPKMEIFSHLPPQVLAGRISLVCKEFRELALNVSFYKPYVKLIDRAEYGAYAEAGLNFDGLPPIDLKTAIARALPFFGRLDKEGFEIDRDAGVAILDIPANLSFPVLGALTGYQANTLDSPYYFGPGFEHLAEPVAKAYRIMISCNILKGSLSLSPEAQIAIVNKVKCQLPKVLEMGSLYRTLSATSSVAHYEGVVTLCLDFFTDSIGFPRLECGAFRPEICFILTASSAKEDASRGVGVVRVLSEPQNSQGGI